MRFVWIFLISAVAFAQSGGTITGTVADPAGAVVAGAPIEAVNTATNAKYPVASSTTGNYTLAELPAGTYNLTITVPGFKKFIRLGLEVQAAETIRVDAALEVGNAAELVTVTAAATLLKTESGELSQTVSTEAMDALPLLVVGVDSSGIRNPYAGTFMLPGALVLGPNFNEPGLNNGAGLHINGNPAASETALVDGMDNTNVMVQRAAEQNAPGQDAIAEFTVQTSNYSAEYGQTGGAVVNMVMKSGTNQYHGSLYYYGQNEALNAGDPFTNNGSSGLLRPELRRNDYGLTLGGPIRIPKVYNGRNKTFFFFGWEQFIQDSNSLQSNETVPTAAYRTGNFSSAITAAGNHSVGTDPTGATIFANEIFDPLTAHTVNGSVVTTPFSGNIIPLTRFASVSQAMQALLPAPSCLAGGTCNVNSAINNFQNTEVEDRTTYIPSLKLDQIISPKDKLSFYWSRTGSYCLTCYGTDGLPQPVSGTFGVAAYGQTERLNYDHTLTPTLLLHLGVGFNYDDEGRPSVTPSYNSCTNLSLCSAAFTTPTTFPEVTGLYNAQAGGMTGAAGTSGELGPGGRVDDLFSNFNNIASLTWVKNNHTFKFGGSLNFIGYYQLDRDDLQGLYGFSSAETAEPYLSTITGGVGASKVGAYSLGFPYASFLLGAVDNATVDVNSLARYGKHALGLYAQDSWKITRKFTLDYGLRYDYSTYYTEQFGRSPQFDSTLADPSAGNMPGDAIYQATCHCQFAHNYPYGFGPRLGFAWQAAPKTVLRGGVGILYSGTGAAQIQGGPSGNAGSNNPFGPTVPGQPVMTWPNVTVRGAPLTAAQIAWPNYSPSYYPIGGVLPGTGPQYLDPNAGRPARQYQYSFTVQRELATNLVVDVAYVGNRGIWWPTYADEGGSMVNYNYLSPQLLSHYGLSLSNPADLVILQAPLNSAAAGPFFGQIPFSGFPLTATVAQSLRPYPQFNAGVNSVMAPLGDTWYNSLQTTANKRLSHGLSATAAFAWSKNLNTMGGTANPENFALAKGISEFDQPFQTRVSLLYSLPKWGSNKVLSYIVRDWTLDAFGDWASGLPLASPTATAAGPGYSGSLSSATMANLTFVPNQYQIPTGQPFYLDNLNCHCFDPTKTIVLNAAAWTNPAPGQYGGAAYNTGFRQVRQPVENFGVGRKFPIKEWASLSVRVEFVNIFNRTYLNTPSTTSPQTAATCITASGANGVCSAGETVVSGFGYINTSTTAQVPRQGQIVARISF
jgi:hypothetical protein